MEDRKVERLTRPLAARRWWCYWPFSAGTASGITLHSSSDGSNNGMFRLCLSFAIYDTRNTV